MSAQAVRFVAAADKYSRAAAGIDASTNLTVAMWVRLVTDRDTYSMFWADDNAGSNYVQFGTTATGSNYVLTSSGGGVGSSFDFTPGTWTFVAFVIDRVGTTERFIYWAEAGSGLARQYMFTIPTSAFQAANTMYIGTDGFGSRWHGDVAAVKIWAAALTQAELEAEMGFYRPQRVADLWAAYSFWDGPQTVDDSGNGRTLTAAGTLTAVAGPPIALDSTVTVAVADAVHAHTADNVSVTLTPAAVVAPADTRHLHRADVVTFAGVAPPSNVFQAARLALVDRLAAGGVTATLNPRHPLPCVLVGLPERDTIGQGGIGAWPSTFPIQIMTPPPGDNDAANWMLGELQGVLSVVGGGADWTYRNVIHGGDDVPAYIVTVPVPVPNPNC